MAAVLQEKKTMPTDTQPERFFQQHQPDGVPPLELTGERTLPDIPQENYWFKRHLAVYQWIAAQTAGMNVVDLACGEGYGADILAKLAHSVIGVDANPEAFEHAKCKYQRTNLRFERTLIESFDRPCDAFVFLQTIEHIETVDQLLTQMTKLAPVAYISTPNVYTLAPAGAKRSDNPWHVHEYQPQEFLKLLKNHYASVEMLGLFHARKLQLHAKALQLGWDTVHKKLGITKRFYDWFVPKISASDFALKPEPLDRSLDLVAVCKTH